MSLWTPEKITERVLRNATEISQINADSYLSYVDWGKKKRAPDLEPTPGFEVRIRQECFRVLMYSAIAHAGSAAKASKRPIDVPAVRQLLTAALMSAPPEVAGPAGEIKKRVAQYHAAWKSGPDQFQAELFKGLADATGLAGTPFEKVMAEVSSHGAKSWVSDGAGFIKSAVG